MKLTGALAEANQPHFFHRGIALQEPFRLPHRNAGGAVHREAIGSGADGRKRDRADALLLGQRKAASIAAREQLIFAVLAIAPDWANRVKNPLGWQPVAPGDFRLPGRAAAQFSAFFQQLRPSRSMNRAVHAAAAQQGGVRGVYDSVHHLPRDVALHHFNPVQKHLAAHSFSLPHVTNVTHSTHVTHVTMQPM